MSADLLRRAAAYLLECEGGDVGEVLPFELDPAGVKALAGWLTATAEVVDGNDVHDGFDLDLVDDTCRGAVAMATAILPGGGDGQ